jgi:predicted signal transduction protein with EAL and GGDEF domain
MTLWTFTMSTMTMKQEHVIFMNTHIMTTSVTTISIDLTLVILILCLAYLIYLHHLKHCRPWDMLSAKLEKSNKQLSQLTLLDNLTKLPNRILLKNHIDSLIEISKQTEKDFFVLLLILMTLNRLMTLSVMMSVIVFCVELAVAYFTMSVKTTSLHV